MWIGVIFVLVRIATHGEFTLGGLESTFDEDTPQLTLLTVTAAGSLYFTWRALRTRMAGSDVQSVGWSIAVGIVGGVLWLLGHGSAPVIIVLAILAGGLAHASSVASQAR